jgi:LPXTG-motif cell wall-anchored protein
MPPTTTPDASPDQSMVNVDATVPTPSTTPAIAKYKGCYSRLHKTHGTYSIYCPIGRQPPAGASTAGLFGAFGALAETVTPAPPAGTVKVADEATQPPGTIPAGTEDTRPFYKSPWFWAGVIGVAAVGGGGFLYYRRRRHV